MFGMSLGEMLVLGVVAIVVVGPRNLPSMLRNAGQLIGRLRKMAADIRAESGIDEILEVEGIRSEIETFRKLASGQMSPDDPLVVPDRDREYPPVGPDVYGAVSEDLVPYDHLLEAPATGEPTTALDGAHNGSALPAAAEGPGDAAAANAEPAPSETDPASSAPSTTEVEAKPR